MIQAKAFSGHAAAVFVGMGAGKVDAGIPWWVIVAGVLVFYAAWGVFTTHSPKGDEPGTRRVIREELAAHNLELKSVKETIDSLPIESVGADGTRYAELPEGTQIAVRPNGTLRFAIPVDIRASPRTGVPTVTAGLTTVKAGEDDG